MALIYCSRCLNEYDNHSATCPYCGTPTPAAQRSSSRSAVWIIAIVILIALVYAATEKSSQIQEWVQEMITPHARSENITIEETRSRSNSSDEHSNSLFYETVSIPPLSSQVSTGVEVIDAYTSRLIYELEQIDSPFTISSSPKQIQNNQFIFDLDDKVSVTLTTNDEQDEIILVALNDTQRNNFDKHLGNARGIFFLPFLRSSNLNLSDTNDRVDYLIQMIDAQPQHKARYELKNAVLSGHYDKNSISIELTQE